MHLTLNGFISNIGCNRNHSSWGTRYLLSSKDLNIHLALIFHLDYLYSKIKETALENEYRSNRTPILQKVESFPLIKFLRTGRSAEARGSHLL
ncbi:hypothetical protein KP79_PYT05625 [Mizuhopecten yessoensis]|uniref:Uncharacterized protein n=1 Tax=Mizuhopecten yessoensis TaxID=6573 RepID=A0A210QSV3_MIZYE|nr:hypothetical protein KP79_PYT05625 [Mizuhopecten yessoensis]